ncbi:MAG: hypothetical protein ACXWBP_06640 [Limisphaerales bacterium]
MKAIKTTAIAALLGAAALSGSVGTASAYVVCNRFGDCWRTDHRYRYEPSLQVRFHDDNWYFHRRWDDDHEHHWRDWHDGRGYWRNGVWITF